MISYKRTQYFNDQFRYKSVVQSKTFDCKTYRYFLGSKKYFKNNFVYSDTVTPIKDSRIFSDQDSLKIPQLKENNLLEDIVKNICKSFYPNGAKMYIQKTKNGKIITREDTDNDCKILLDNTATADEKSDARYNLITRGLMPSSGDNAYCYEVLEKPIEIK